MAEDFVSPNTCSERKHVAYRFLVAELLEQLGESVPELGYASPVPYWRVVRRNLYSQSSCHP